MKLHKFILLCIFLFQLYIYKVWLSCIRFTDFFQFSALDAHLKTDNAIMNDVGYSTVLVRVFHNKIWVYSTEIANRYLHFWNTNFEVLFISFVGVVGLLYGLYYQATHPRKSLWLWIYITYILLVPMLVVFVNSIPFIIKISALAFPLYLFSNYGIYRYLENHQKMGKWVVILLLIISLWYFAVFQKDIFVQFCYNK